MPEIFDLIFNFVDVFRDNFDLSGTLSSGTESYLQTTGDIKEEKNNDTINVKIEAPVLIVPENDKTWITDLGTFEIRKDPHQMDHHPKGLTFLEGRKTRMFFTGEQTNLSNLNMLETYPNKINEVMEAMTLIVSDLGFLVELGKSTIAVKEGLRPGDRRVATVNLNFKPFKVNLVDQSMKSFCNMIVAFANAGSREKEKIAKIKEKSAGFKEGLEYHLGYDSWQKCEIYIDNFFVYAINPQGKLIASHLLNQLIDIKREEGEKVKRLILNFRRKKVEIRSASVTALSEIQFKINSIESIIKSEQSNNAPEDLPALSNDLVVSFSIKAIDLFVSGYHSEGTNFMIKLGMARYQNRSLDGVEEGAFTLQSLNITDHSDNSNIISLKDQDRSLSYNYQFREGSIDSVVDVKHIESSYKEEYTRSILRLIEFLMDNLLNNELEQNDSKNNSEEELTVSLFPVATTTFSARSDLKIKIGHSKFSVFYKKNLKCLDLVAKNIEIKLLTEGSVITLEGDIGDVGAYDLHKYPFKLEDFRDSLAVRVPMVQMKKGGYVKFNVLLNETEAKADVFVKKIVVDWVQQRAMRLIDFIMFQVLEVFYPTLYSFSKYYSKENVIRFALSLLNDPSFVKQHIELDDVEFNLCSTTNMDHKISVVVAKTVIDNDRVLIPKVINKDKINYFPFGNLESDVWKIKVMKVKADIVDESLLDEMAADPSFKPRERHTEYFDLEIEVDLLTKLFELSFLYDIVDDFEKFDDETKSKFNSNFLNPVERTSKTAPTAIQVKAQAHYFIHQKQKQKLFINGRYNVRIVGSTLDINFTNKLLNKIYAISSNNITFDDGKDDIFRNTYVQSTGGLQVYITMDIEDVAVRAKDFKQADFELFRMEIKKLKIIINKRSNFINEIEVTAKTLKSVFNEELGIPSQYLEYLGTYNEDVSERAFELAKNFIALNPTAANHIEHINEEINYVRAFLLMTPDYKKDIQVTISNIRLIVFTFIIRLFPELLVLEPLVEHKGYEDPNYSIINIMMKLDNSEVCLASNREGCIVLYGKS